MNSHSENILFKYDLCSAMQKKSWMEHFQELLNRSRPEEPPDIPAAETDLDMSMERPSMAEIVRAIKALKSGKAAGPDGIPPEALKSDTQTSAGILYSFFGKIWDDE